MCVYFLFLSSIHRERDGCNLLPDRVNPPINSAGSIYEVDDFGILFVLILRKPHNFFCDFECTDSKLLIYLFRTCLV